ncbi:MAG: hypothetical protein VKJ06_01710 [Vampirovibrionales bacterium]|nr:hypothetical protein [Vampirovibrionales bacterium]
MRYQLILTAPNFNLKNFSTLRALRLAIQRNARDSGNRPYIKAGALVHINLPTESNPCQLYINAVTRPNPKMPYQDYEQEQLFFKDTFTKVAAALYPQEPHPEFSIKVIPKKSQ